MSAGISIRPSPAVNRPAMARSRELLPHPTRSRHTSQRQLHNATQGARDAPEAEGEHGVYCVRRHTRCAACARLTEQT